MKAIINRKENFGTLNGVVKHNREILTVVNRYLKKGSAILLIDTETVLMYELKEIYV